MEKYEVLEVVKVCIYFKLCSHRKNFFANIPRLGGGGGSGPLDLNVAPLLFSTISLSSTSFESGKQNALFSYISFSYTLSRFSRLSISLVHVLII